MSGNLLYAVGTLASWLGWGCGIWALYQLLSIFLPGTNGDRSRKLGIVLTAAIVSAAALVFSSRMPHFAGQESTGFRLPLIWFVMPLWAWIATAAAVMTVLRSGQAFAQQSGPSRQGLLRAALIWAGVFLISTVLYERGEDRIQLLQGGIELSYGVVTAVILLIVAAVAGMHIAARFSTSRNWSRAAVTHLLLITGSVLFGLPFAFLLVTSFKEDRDMSSPNGIVWVPRVQQTVTYMDTKDPLFEGAYRGRTVRGSAVATSKDGSLQIEILDPASMRGLNFYAKKSDLKEVAKQIPLVTATLNGQPIQGKVVEEMLDGRRRVVVTQPAALAGREQIFDPTEVEPVREIGLRWQNYTEALDYMPPETLNGLMYLKNTLIIVILSVIGTVLSSSIVAYAFGRMKFPGRDLLFAVLLATMMLPGAVTLLPKFLIFRWLGWIDTLYPLWVPAFFASAFNVFLLRQFFKNIPSELEDAARIDGCNPARTFWSVMLPLVKPALAYIGILAFMGAWNNFIEPLIYISSPERMPIAYALQLFQGERSGEPGLLMAFATMSMIPVLLLFFFSQKYFVESVTLSGLGGR